jgi:hypothetical protein
MDESALVMIIPLLLLLLNRKVEHGDESAPVLIILHCHKNPIYVFFFWELRGLSPNFHIHVSVSDLYIPRIGPHIFLQRNRQTDPKNI